MQPLVESKKSTVLSRFAENKIAVICLLVLVIMTLFSYAGSLLINLQPDKIDYFHTFTAPLTTSDHPLGTDDLGRDVLARLAYGGRISLGIGIGVAIAASIIGTVLGALAGFYGGIIDTLISRTIDILMGIPLLALLLVISGFINVQPFHLGLIMAFLSWMSIARLVRGEVLTLRDAEFIQAARSLGVPSLRIVFRHLLPSVLAPVTVAATLAVAYTILAESSLSYLGFGVHPPTATWGNMLQGAQRYMRTAPWLAVYPGLLIAITVTCFNFVGDALREAVDPRLKGRI